MSLVLRLSEKNEYVRWKPEKIMKRLIVQKFGGSSLANPQLIQNVAKRIAHYRKCGNELVVVVSALGDTTDELIELAKKISDNPPEREMDMLLSTGEQISVALLAMAIHELGYQVISLTGSQVGIITDTTHTKARIVNIRTGKIRNELNWTPPYTLQHGLQKTAEWYRGTCS